MKVEPRAGKPSALVDTRVIYCGDNLEQLKKLPDACVDLIYIDPPFNSNRNYEVFWGEAGGAVSWLSGVLVFLAPPIVGAGRRGLPRGGTRSAR